MFSLLIFWEATQILRKQGIVEGGRKRCSAMASDYACDVSLRSVVLSLLSPRQRRVQRLRGLGIDSMWGESYSLDEATRLREKGWDGTVSCSLDTAVATHRSAVKGGVPPPSALPVNRKLVDCVKPAFTTRFTQKKWRRHFHSSGVKGDDDDEWEGHYLPQRSSTMRYQAPPPLCSIQPCIPARGFETKASGSEGTPRSAGGAVYCCPCCGEAVEIPREAKHVMVVMTDTLRHSAEKRKKQGSAMGYSARAASCMPAVPPLFPSQASTPAPIPIPCPPPRPPGSQRPKSAKY